MCGYCLKDEGQSWFQTRIFNITRFTTYHASITVNPTIPREELEHGRLQHIAQLTAFDENKTVLTQRNLIAEVYKFSRRSLYPLVTPLRYTLLYAIQSGEYVPSPEWIRKYAKMEHPDAEALWCIIHNPKSATIEQTDTVFFDSRSLSGLVSNRYFIIPRANSSQTETPRNSGTTSTASRAPSVPAYMRIAALLHGRRPVRRTPMPLDEFTCLPIDGSENVCASTLEEALFTVRQLRASRTDILHDVPLSQGTLSAVTPEDLTDEEPDLSPVTPRASSQFPAVSVDYLSHD